jgi:hypothetical protein
MENPGLLSAPGDQLHIGPFYLNRNLLSRQALSLIRKAIQNSNFETNIDD